MWIAHNCIFVIYTAVYTLYIMVLMTKNKLINIFKLKNLVDSNNVLLPNRWNVLVLNI